MKLYYLPGACSLADHIALAWAGADFEAVRVKREELRSEWFRELNSAGSVPVLVEDDGWVLTENVAILNYVADKYPAAGLGSDDIRVRASILRWLAHLASDLHKGFSPIFSPGRFHDDEAVHPALKEKAVARIRTLLDGVDRRLQGKTRPIGERRSIVDPYLFVILRWTEKLAGGIAGWDNLERFHDAMAGDPVVHRVLAEEGLV